MSRPDFDPRGNQNVGDISEPEYGSSLERIIEWIYDLVRWMRQRDPIAPGDPWTKFATFGRLFQLGIVTEAQVLGDDTPVEEDEEAVEPEYVVVHAREMYPSISNGASAVSQAEIASAKPNIQYIEFSATVDESVDFQLIMPFGWTGNTFQYRVYWSHPTGATAYGVVWQLQAHSVTDQEPIGVDLVGSILSTDTGGTTDTLYITSESGAVTISGVNAKAGDLIFLRITRLAASNASDTLDVVARLHAIRFNLGEVPVEFPATEGVGLVVYEAEDVSPGGTVTSGPAAARSDFMARLSVSGVETFDGTFTFEGDIYDFEDSLAMDGIGVVVNGVTATFDKGTVSGALSSGRFNTTSGGSLYVQLGGVLTMLTLTFDSPIAAFGAYFTDVGDFVGQVSATLHRTGGGTVSVDFTHTLNGANGSLMFWGFVDDTDTYDSIDIVTSSTAEAIGMDDMVIATAAQLA